MREAAGVEGLGCTIRVTMQPWVQMEAKGSLCMW